MPLDRFSFDAVMPNDFAEQRAGANGDWIVTVSLELKWDLVNMYTHRKFALPSVMDCDATETSALTYVHDGHRIKLPKIVICQVPTAAGGYEDYSLVAVFDSKIVFLHGHIRYGWTILDNQFLGYFKYHDSIIKDNLVFTVTEAGSVSAWEPLSFGKFSSLYSGLASLFLDVC